MPLPTSQGNDAILVVVDRLTKMAHFIPTVTTADSAETSRLVLTNIVRLHGVPDDIVSDRGSVFTSRVWELMCERLKIERKLSTAFHPQTDGQTERINQIMEQYLRAFCGYEQDDWVTLLPFAEFSYNNAESASTKVSPFLANYGFNPSMDYDRAVVPQSNEVSLLDDIKEVQNYLTQELTLAQERYKHFADDRRSVADKLEVGDRAWVSTENIRTTRPMKKLDYQWIGPYKVTRKINDVAFEVALPASIRIHNVFHSSKLRKYSDKDSPPRARNPTPLPLVIQDQEYHEVERILDSRTSGRSVRYFVDWKGFGIKDRTWEPFSMLNEDAPDMVKEFHFRNPRKPKPANYGNNISDRLVQSQ